MRSKTFQEHLEEFRKVFIQIGITFLTGFLFSFFYHKTILHLLTSSIVGEDPINHAAFLLLSPLEGILVTLKVSFWTGLIGTSPLWLMFLLGFILPGLKKEERKIALPLLSLSLLFLFLGFFFALKFTLPLSNQMLAGFNSSIGVNAWSLSFYIDYALLMLAGHGLLFETAVILFLLAHFGIFTYDFFKKKRRFFILGAFILGAIFTPPDILTQFLFAIPCCLFYEMAANYAYFIEKKKRKKALYPL